MRYKFFASSQKAWRAMFDAISFAEKSIYLEMYIFQDDITEFDFLTLLKEKAQSGVKVKMILDSFGSSGLSKKAVSEIRESKIELLFLSYFLHRTHRKILVVDDDTAFIGGVNFYQASSLWNDLMVRAKGKIVKSITRSFAKAYVEAGGKDIEVVNKSLKLKPESSKKIKQKLHDWLVEHSPSINKFRLKKIYTEHISSAKENVTLVTPYFMPKRWLIGLLHQAHLRGVDVQILIPEDTSYYFLDRINYIYICKLAKLGIKFYIERQMNHAKIMMIDGREAIVGSNNLDYLSFDLNSEIGIFFNDIKAVNEISSIISEWKKDSLPFDTCVYKAHWFDYLLSPIIRIFARIL
ncbi:MAG: phosphatidylserine/phosphatidylglycerophosphate/cardiolipin synthase family protein [bacterium]